MNPMAYPSPTRRQWSAFTLVELLVAMSVLFGVLLLVTVLVSNVTKTTEISTRSVDSDAVARLFFARLGADINSMVIRDDIHYGFRKIGGGQDDVIAFLSSTESQAGSRRPLNIISYERFQPLGGVESLQRASKSAVDLSAGTGNWTAPMFATGTPALNNNADDLVTSVALADADFQSFGREIIRIEFSFLEKQSSGQLITRAVPPSKVSALKGIVVAIAVLDSKFISRLSQTNLTSLSNALTDSDLTAVVEGDSSSGTASVDIAAVWKSNLSGISAGDLGEAANNVRVYQRIFLFQQ